MPDDEIRPLSREETLTLLLEGLPEYLASVHRIIEFARGMAEGLGGDTRVVMDHLLDRHERPERLVRLSVHALRTPPDSEAGGDHEN
ncbi:hypothetical protein [Nocardia sp. NPDC050793]|uniref:hypothetical protein n=1 Tax=Nocardia sp. NPDC050793 TaxID=3155159 RepID=UPI0033DBB394